MCGISGIVANNAKDYDRQIGAMIKSLDHRGPDANGRVFLDGCVLGHNRLSIVDLVTGSQPMFSHDKKDAITFNGEIYGYKSIRESLVGEYPFSTASDTEIIIALYQKYGEKMMRYLPGAFSFAIWDAQRHQLFCARDRFGEKPFYYAVGDGGEFIFASEIKAIIATGLVTPVLDTSAVFDYMQHLFVPPNKTIYKNIRTLPPAHILIFKNKEIFIERYWHLPSAVDALTLDEAVDKFRWLLDRAVRKQLIADVPVGAFLSGGLDSSTIVAIASKYSKAIKTFSFGFEDSRNELPFARKVASLYNTDHIELRAEENDIGQLLRVMQSVYDEPFADSSNIPTYLIAKLASERTKVVLTGDGGDELFGGYRNWYRPLYMMQKDSHTSLVKMSLVRILAKVFSVLGLRNSTVFNHRYRGAMYRRHFSTIAEAHLSQNVCFSEKDLEGLGLSPNIIDLEKSGIAFTNTVDDAMRLDILDYMPGDILVKIDRASLANGLELRAPFLDIDFASFCISLPYRLKITDSDDKFILRESFSDKWPEEIRSRGKQGFGAPVSKWLNLPSVKKLKDECLNSSSHKIFQLIHFEQSRKFVQRNDYHTWVMLVLALWMDNHDFKY